ncbi:MAG TPA: hypothetical protein VF037_01140 [Gemmatimonadales bacterium]
MRSFIQRWRTAILVAAAALMALAIVLPLWGMTLVSIQYPEGLRMVVYPGRIAGDLAEINSLNRYIGMTPISSDFFVELRLLPIAFGAVAALIVAAAIVRTRWSPIVPLLGMATVAAYGFLAMRERLYQFGHDLDPTAPITIEPFTPPMVGLNQIAQFASYTYFSWGTFLPIAAGVLVALVLWAGLPARGPARAEARLALAA